MKEIRIKVGGIQHTQDLLERDGWSETPILIKVELVIDKGIEVPCQKYIIVLTDGKDIKFYPC